MQHNDRSQVQNDTKDQTAIQTDRSEVHKDTEGQTAIQMVGYEIGSQFGFNSDFGKQIARSFHFHSTLIDKQQQTTAGSNKQQLLRTVTAHDFKPQNISLMRAKLFGKQTPQYSFDWYTQPSSTDGKDYSNQEKKKSSIVFRQNILLLR